MRPRPDNASADPAVALDAEIARLADAIRALQDRIYDDERRALRRAAVTLQEWAYAANATSIQTTRPHNGRVRVSHIITSATAATLTLQLMGDANNTILALTPATGIQNVSFGGESGGLILQPGDIVKLTTTGAAGPMALIVMGERLPDTYTY